MRVIASYLPQFHPISENDEWWGKGFTEWTNVTKAKPLFTGHHQPNLPKDLGFYDLRNPESREAQAQMAAEHGIEGFSYWHYWLGNGKRILERPFNEVLLSGKPDYLFCLAWANHDWTGVWFGNFDEVLLKQEYPGKVDYELHFDYLSKAFSDPRYITIDDKPIFSVHRPYDIPDLLEFTDTFRDLAHKYGFKGIYLIGDFMQDQDIKKFGFDGSTYPFHRRVGNRKNGIINKLKNLALTRSTTLKVYTYKQAMKFFLKESYSEDQFPCIVPNWDSTPRLGKRGLVLTNSNPVLFKEHVIAVKGILENRPKEKRIAFLKSWNEWAEGNYIEPDLRFGRSYLETLKSVITDNNHN